MAEITAGEALIALRATSEKLSADMAAATKLITGELQRIEQQASTSGALTAQAWSGAQIALGLVSKAAVAVAGSMAAAEAAAVALTVRTVEQGDELNRLSSQYGVAVETLAGMKQAFKDNNLEAGDLNTALRQFSNVLGEAMAGGDKAIATVSALGIDVEKLKNGTLTTEQAFRIAVDSLAGMTEGYGRASIATDLFGRSGSKIPVIFKDGAKSLDDASNAASEMGNSFNAVEQQAVAKLDDAMDELSNRVSGLGASIGKELMPVAADIVREANEWIKANRELVKQDVRAFVEGIRDGMKSLLPLVKSVADALGFVGDVIAGISGPAKQSFAALVEEEKRLVAETEDAANLFRVFHPLTKELGDSADYAGQHYNALQAQLSVVRSKIAATLDPTKKATLSLADLQRVTDDESQAALASAEAHGKVAPPIIATGDAAEKAGKKLSEQANALAESAQKSVQYAQSQLDLAAATGDMQRVQDAYIVTMGEARTAYEKSIAAAGAAAQAGKSDAEVQNMRTEALRQYVTTAQGAAGTLAKIGAEQIKAAQDLSKYTADLTIARDQDALSMASAKDVGELYTKTLVDIGERLKAEREEIEAKRGVTISAAEADKLLMEAEERAAQEISKAGAAAAKAGAQLSKMDQIIDDLAGHLAEVSLDLGLALLGGQLSWKAAGKQLAADFAKEALDEVKTILLPGMKEIFKGLIGSSGLGGIVQGVGSWVGSLFGDSASAGLQQAVQGIGTNQGILSAAIASGGQVGTAATTGFAATLTAAAPYAAAAAAAAGVLYGVVTTSQMGPEAKAAIITALAGPLAGGLLYAFGVLDNPDMRKRIAQHVEKTIQTALSQDADFRGAIEAGLGPLGYELNAALAKSLSNASRSNDLLRRQAEILGEKYGADFMAGFSPAFTASVNKHGASSTSVPASDWIRAFFPDADAATQAYADELAKSLASVEVAQMGLTGADAITYTENIAAGFINYAQSVGMTEEELIQFLETSNQAAGMSTTFFATLDQLNGAMIENGVSLSDVNAQISKFTGLDLSSAGNLVDLFIASGESADTFVKQLDKIAESDPGLRSLIDSLDPPLVDALQAVEDGGNAAAKAIGKLTGQANTSLAGAEARILAFGDALFTVAEDGSKKLSTLGEELNSELVSGISGIEDAIKEEVNSAAGLTSDTLGKAFAELKSLAALPAEALDDSTTAAIDHLKAVIQAATGWTAEQIDTMIATAADVPPPVQPVPPETTASLDGAADSTGQIADNSQAAADASQQLTAATQGTAEAVAATTQGFADLATQTTASLDGAADSTGQIADNSQAAADASDGLSGSMQALAGQVDGLASGPSVSEALGLTPEAAAAINDATSQVVGSVDDLASTMQGLADQVASGGVGFDTLAQSGVVSSEQIQAALQGIYGTADDETSLSAINELLGPILSTTLDETTAGVLGATGTWHDSFDFARGGVLMLKEAVDAIPTDKTITFHLVTDGSIPTSGTVTTDVPTSHTGELIPGVPGTEVLRVLEAGELVLPADLSARLLSGATIAGADVARIASAPAVSYAASRAPASASQAAPALPIASGWTFVPIREDALIDRALVRLERDTRDGRGTIADGRFTAHPMTHARARRG